MLNDKSTHKIIVGGLLIIMGILFFSGNANALSNDTLEQVYQFSNTMGDNITGTSWSSAYNYITGINGFGINGTSTITQTIPNEMKGTSWTLVFWVKDTLNPTSSSGIMQNHDGSNGWAIRNYATKFDYYDGSGYNDVAISKVDHQWTMITLMMNGTKMYMYQNTTKLQTSTPGSMNSGSNWRISPQGNTAFDGLDEIMFFNNSLEDANITELYNSGAGKFYPFEEESIPQNATDTNTITGSIYLDLATCGVSTNTSSWSYGSISSGVESGEISLNISNTGNTQADFTVYAGNWVSAGGNLSVNRTAFANYTGNYDSKLRVSTSAQTIKQSILDSFIGFFQFKAIIGDSPNSYSQNLTVGAVC